MFISYTKENCSRSGNYHFTFTQTTCQSFYCIEYLGELISCQLQHAYSSASNSESHIGPTSIYMVYCAYVHKRLSYQQPHENVTPYRPFSRLYHSFVMNWNPMNFELVWTNVALIALPHFDTIGALWTLCGIIDKCSSRNKIHLDLIRSTDSPRSKIVSMSL